MSMSRIHGRSPCDWVIEFDRGCYGAGATGMITGLSTSGYGHSIFAPPPRLTLSVDLTMEQAQELVDQPNRARGMIEYKYVSQFGLRDPLVRVTGIEITADEAEAISGGTSPLEILQLGSWPEHGYRLKVVVDSPGDWKAGP